MSHALNLEREKVEQHGTKWPTEIIGYSSPPLNAFRFEGGSMRNLRSILAALAMLLMATAAHAQQTRLSATVPFNFVVGDRSYPAGDYLFSNNDAVLKITNAKQAKTELILSNTCRSVRPSRDTKLIFDSMGGYYFLRQIWVAGNSSGRELPRSRTEVRMAQNHEKQESVIVAANIPR
jgi:hypothetical protein